MNALTQTFPNSFCLLNLWHMSTNIFDKQRKSILTLDTREEFVQDWNGLVAAIPIVNYEPKYALMHVAFIVVSCATLSTLGLCIRKRSFLYFTKLMSLWLCYNVACGVSPAALEKWISVSTG